MEERIYYSLFLEIFLCNLKYFPIIMNLIYFIIHFLIIPFFPFLIFYINPLFSDPECLILFYFVLISHFIFINFKYINFHLHSFLVSF